MVCRYANTLCLGATRNPKDDLKIPALQNANLLMRWAILGTGVVSRKFCLGLSALGGQAQVSAVASRNPNNAKAFTASLGLGYAVPDYEAAITAPDVDAVYIATPAHLHEAHAILAFAAGKPALIEKPLAHDAVSGARIAAAANDAKVFAMEAMWTRFLPLISQIRDKLAAAELGDLRGFHGSFMRSNVPDASVSLFNPHAGGALLHRGVYPLSLAHMFLGPVTDIHASARLGDTGVDEDIILTLTHKNGALSDIRASVRAEGSNACTLWGTHGRIDIAGPIWRPEGARLIPTPPAAVTSPTPARFEAFRESRFGQRVARWRTGLKRRGMETLPGDFLGNGYAHEAQHLMQAVKAGQQQSDIMPLQDSVDILKLVDTALLQVGATT